ncbi:MAG: hypothetical protein DMG42_13245 [Acidobacteria bacterium]|nr:MAG: hypothetical protein DMG42_13245 [Acidobacteriota bacterium]
MSRCSKAFPPFLEVKRWAGSSFRCCSVNSARSPWESPATILIVLSKNALLVWRPGVMSRASKKKEEGMDIFPWGLAGGAIALAVFAFLVSQMVFTIHTKQAAVIEKFGKFERLAGPGLNFKVPFIEKVVYIEDLNMQLMGVPVMSKTKDDATVTVPVRVQYYVLPGKVKEAYYELDDPED